MSAVFTVWLPEALQILNANDFWCHFSNLHRLQCGQSLHIPKTTPAGKIVGGVENKCTVQIRKVSARRYEIDKQDSKGGILKWLP